MSRPMLLVLVLVCLASWGCAKAQPIITPEEFAASCQAGAAGAAPACAARVCAVYQAVVTDFHEDKESCRATCKTRADELLASVPAQCGAKVKAARDACLEFCQRKFYRCNCTK